MRSLLVGIAIVIAGATATRAQTLPFYNIDELAKKCVETAAEAATKYSRLGDLSSFLADEAVCKALSNMDRQSLAELAKNWNLLASSIRLQCIANRSVDSYFGLKQCIEQVAKRGSEIAGVEITENGVEASQEACALISKCLHGCLHPSDFFQIKIKEALAAQRQVQKASDLPPKADIESLGRDIR